MMHTADLLKLFQPHRNDAIVIPGRGGRHWVHLTGRARRWTCRSAIPPWAAMPVSRSASRWRSRTGG